MRILLFNNSHLPVVGGKEVVVHQLALAFGALGHDVALAGPGAWWRFRDFDAGYPVHRWPRVPGLARELAWKSLYSWRAARFDCDVVHAHTTYPNGYVAAKVAAHRRFPLIITPHGADIHKVPELNFGHRLDPRIDAKIRWALQQADCATAISKSVVDSLQDAGLSADRIVEIPNGVDVARFRVHADFDVHHHLGIPSDAALIVSIGNYHPRKGHELLIRSVRAASHRVPNMRLVIVGSTSRQLMDWVDREGLGHLVKFTGSLPYPLPGDPRPDILAALLQASCIYVSSSIGEGSEGLSLALLEAMSAGACVVASSISGNRDVIDNNRNGLLVPSDCPEGMTRALIWLCENAQQRQRMADAGRKYVEQQSWTRIAARYVELFERAITARSNGRRLSIGNAESTN
ncbi:MAG: glycosyltransferase family 4 protein [Pseudomonadales bacterium]